ncbi:hypothetical protein ACH4U5_32805 [Streptomyces sp. NPDC020858]|uniref:hypothetical protein n=1 Tax=Streptomyces sp. NPDC020858 TaxID=3365097 RepID=UPI0037B6BE8F
MDNSGREAVDDYSLELVLWTLDTFGWESGDIQTEVYAPDSKGTWGWHAVEAYGSEEVYSLSLADVDVEKNEVFDLKLRMKFGKDTPPTRFSLSTTAEGGTADRVRYESKVTGPQLEESSEVVFAYNSILPARTGNQPTPDGGTKPIADGNGNGNGNGNSTSPATGGRLAETGADAATSWALGGAGIALAMGAALVAGTGRRRRPTA